MYVCERACVCIDYGIPFTSFGIGYFIFSEMFCDFGKFKTLK